MPRAPGDLRVNLYSRDECRIWVKSVPAGDDVSFEEMDRFDLDLGEAPTWLTEIDVSVVEMFDPGCTLRNSDKWSLPARAKWLLEEGLAPGQPFLLSVGEPHYYSYETECGREYDCDFYTEVIDKDVWTPQRSAAAWQRFLHEAPATFYAEIRRQKREERIRWGNKKAMALRFVHFGGTYDDYIPDKVRCVLVSRMKTRRNPQGFSCDLIHGPSHASGQINEAVESLRLEARKKGIKFTAKQFTKLPRLPSY